MPDQIAERLRWAVEMLAVKPADHLLEIGCGHGVAVALVCEKLQNGTITAIDRSPKMIAMAAKRNADHVAAGRAVFHTAALHEANFGAARFDTIFAIHVGVFLRGDPAREFEVIKQYLAPGGKLYLVYQPLLALQAQGVADTLTDMLDHHGFIIKRAAIQELATGPTVCVSAGVE